MTHLTTRQKLRKALAVHCPKHGRKCPETGVFAAACLARYDAAAIEPAAPASQPREVCDSRYPGGIRVRTGGHR